MRSWRWLVPAVLGACTTSTTSDDVVRRAMAEEAPLIDSLIARIDASVGGALNDDAVAFADAPPLAIDRVAPAPLDPRVQGTVSVRLLLDWSSAFMASDGPRILATEGRQAVAAQARSLSDTLRRAAAAPQSAGIDRAIVAVDLARVASQLRRVSCLAEAYDATDNDAQLLCSLAEHLDVLVGTSTGLEAALARSSNALGGAQPVLMSLEAAANSTLVAAQQAQAPPSTIALINNCSINIRTVEDDVLAAQQSTAMLLSSQHAASLAISTALLGDDTYTQLLFLTGRPSAADRQQYLDALERMLEGLRGYDVASGTSAGVSCADVQGFDCIAEKLTGGILRIDPMHSANESSTCVGSAESSMLGGTQYDALRLAAQDLLAAQHAFDLAHPNPSTFVDAVDYSVIVAEHHSRRSKAVGVLFYAR